MLLPTHFMTQWKNIKNCNQHSLREIQTENYTANAYFARRPVYCLSVSWRDSDRTMLLVLALSKRRIYTMRLVCFWQKEKKKNNIIYLWRFINLSWHGGRSTFYLFSGDFFSRWLFSRWLFSRWLFFQWLFS